MYIFVLIVRFSFPFSLFLSTYIYCMGSLPDFKINGLMHNVLMGTLNPTHSRIESNRSPIIVVTTACNLVMLLISRPTATAECATGAMG